MTYDTIQVIPVTPRVGAEVLGVDLTRPTNRQMEEIHAAFLQHQVLFFRDQKLDFDSQKRFGRHFGELHVHPAAPGPAGHPEILPIYADAESKHVNGERWHSDVSCDAEPPLGSMLHLKLLPPVGGDTIFASQYAAYDALSDRMKAYLDGLTALHDGEPFYRGRYEDRGVADAGKVYPRAVHPIVRTHPETGRKALYVNPMFTTRIIGVDRDEGEAILRYLYDHCGKPEFQVRFRWQVDSVAFWDNRAVMHQALWDYFPHTRSGFRVTIKGDAPR